MCQRMRCSVSCLGALVAIFLGDMMAGKHEELPANRAILLDNRTCVYCGKGVELRDSTKEHVIGRRFVPRGTLDRSWNLIVRACTHCNSAKAELEDDISAITLHGNCWGGVGDVDDKVLSEIHRKSKGCVSRLTGKPVKDSQERFTFEVPVAQDAKFTFNFVSPPQIDENRIYELARMHIGAFFYFITYDKTSQIGHFWPEGFYPLIAVHKGDWGHPAHKAFMKSVVHWEPRWIGCGAGDYFCSIIRRHPSETCWAWALEWNKYYRIMGFFGERKPAQIITDTFPSHDIITMGSGDGWSVKYRMEQPLEEKDDILFLWNVASHVAEDK